MRIIVLADHPFAFPSIQDLVQKDLLEAIVTASTNRDWLLQLKTISQTSGVPILQLQSKKWEQQLSVFLRKQKVSAVFVFGFGKKLSPKLLSIPQWGFINFHPSQLPQYRGPNPAFWQIKDRVEQGGITAHKMAKDWDAGDIIGRLPIPITSSMTASHYLSEAGFYALQLMNRIVSALQVGQLPAQPQNNSQATYQKRPSKRDFQIQWEEQTVEDIIALVNACNRELGGAIAFLRNSPLQLLEVSATEKSSSEAIGTVISLRPLQVVAKGNRVLQIEIVQMAEGIMTGTRFGVMAQLKEGEQFSSQ
jgi:methionyl-tRNA formyltransferase